MSENDAIQDLSPFYINSLITRDEQRKQRLLLVGNNFGDDIVDDIAEGNGAEFVRRGYLVLLGDQGYESGIKRREKAMHGSGLLH